MKEIILSEHEYLAFKRKQLKIHMIDVAKALGYSAHTMISNYENGRVSLKPEKIIMYKNYLENVEKEKKVVEYKKYKATVELI